MKDGIRALVKGKLLSLKIKNELNDSKCESANDSHKACLTPASKRRYFYHLTSRSHFLVTSTR